MSLKVAISPQPQRDLGRQRLDLGLGDGDEEMKLPLSQSFDWPPFDHAPIADKGEPLAAQALDHFLAVEHRANLWMFRK